MAHQYLQQRDRGFRHSNPKPQPRKQPERVPGEGRCEADWVIYNRRRSLKVQGRYTNESLVAQAYENMPAKMYRTNVAIVERCRGVGWTRCGGWTSARPGYVMPEYSTEESLRRGPVSNREALGAEPVKKAKSILRRPLPRKENAANEIPSSGRTKEREESGSGNHSDQEAEAPTPEVSPILDGNTLSPEPICISWELELSEDECEWVESEHEMGVEFLDLESFDASKDGNVVK